MKYKIKCLVKKFLLYFIFFMSFDFLLDVLTGKQIKIDLTEWSLPKRYNWSMHGYLISEDGAILDTTTFSVRGKAWKGGKRLEYSFEMPDDFTYPFVVKKEKSENMQEILRERQFCAPYPTYEAPFHQVGTERFIMCQMSIDFKNQFMILFPTDTNRNCIVASADPTVTPEMLTAHFEDFLNTFGWKMKQHIRAQQRGEILTVPPYGILPMTHGESLSARNLPPASVT